jgi:hypothetical protein
MPLCRVSICWVPQFIYLYAECHYTDCRYTEYSYAECRHAKCSSPQHKQYKRHINSIFIKKIISTVNTTIAHGHKTVGSKLWAELWAENCGQNCLQKTEGRTVCTKLWAKPIDTNKGKLNWAERKLMGENLKVFLAKFSTLSQAVFVMSVIAWHKKVRPHLK